MRHPAGEIGTNADLTVTCMSPRARNTSVNVGYNPADKEKHG
jgi:glycerol-3-phosphate dehydrogenase